MTVGARRQSHRRSARRLCLALLLALVSFAAIDGAAHASSDSGLDTYLESQMETAHVPGLQTVIVKHGQIVWSSAYGLANIADGVPMTNDTLINIASISKTAIGVSLMQQVERVNLALNDDVSSALGWTARNYRFPDTPVTLKMLATHTSSANDTSAVDRLEIFDRGDSPIPLDTFCQGYFTEDGAYWNRNNWANREPGTRFTYSNTGAALCADAIEQSTGVDFNEYCKAEIFNKLGMVDTSFRYADLDLERIATPYYYENRRYYTEGHHAYPEYPSGSVHTTADQWARFALALLGNGAYRQQRILEAGSLAEMLSPQIPAGMEPGCGLFAFGDDELVPGRTVWGHDGGDWGIFTEMWLDLERDEGIIMFANGEPYTRSEEKAWLAMIPRLFEKADSIVVPGVALYAGGDLSLKGNSTVTGPLADGLPLSATLVYGDMTGAGNFNLKNAPATVRGDFSWTGNKTGVVTANDSSVRPFGAYMPQGAADTLAEAAKSAPADGSVTSSGGGNLTIKGNSKVTYTTPIHVTGNLVLQGNASLTAPAVYVDGSVSASGNVKADVGALCVQGSWTSSGNVVFTGTEPAYVAGAVTISGNAKWKAPLIVTDGRVTLSGNVALSGAGSGSSPAVILATQDFLSSGNGNCSGVVCVLGDYTGNATVKGQLIVQGTVRCSGNSTVTYDQAANDHLNAILRQYAD